MRGQLGAKPASFSSAQQRYPQSRFEYGEVGAASEAGPQERHHLLDGGVLRGGLGLEDGEQGAQGSGRGGAGCGVVEH